VKDATLPRFPECEVEGRELIGERGKEGDKRGKKKCPLTNKLGTLFRIKKQSGGGGGSDSDLESPQGRE